MEQKTNLVFFVTCLIFLSSSSLHSNFCVASESSSDDIHPYTYKRGSDGEPAKWGKLKKEWQVCGTGKIQSPIDLSSKEITVVHNPGLLQTHYKPAKAVLKNRGHDISVFWSENAGKIAIDGTEYELKQCHWHAPTEHTINGTRFALELHLVHQNSQGKIAVLGVLYKYGQPDPFLSHFVHSIKSIKEEDIDLGVLDPRFVELDSRMFYRYIGSLTTPPCTEGVIWTVITKVGTVSKEQVEALTKAVHPGYEMNARPSQKLDGRPVWLCAP